MKITYTVYDYDFLPTGGYGWTQIQGPTIIDKTLDELVVDLMNEFDIDYGQNGIWECIKNYSEGRIIEFVLHHTDDSKEYVYEISY